MGDSNDRSVEFLYGTRFGKVLLEFILFLRIPKFLGFLLRTPLSGLYVGKFIEKKSIDMELFPEYAVSGLGGTKRFRSFNDFFTRKIPENKLKADPDRSHLISPSDSLLSAFKIEENSVFRVKGFDYTLVDFFGTDGLNSVFAGGDCLIFRLCATDYHRFCYIDDGIHPENLGENHFLPGKLYSVQPRACENFRVYTKNRRSWTILETEHFGCVAQIEVGAFSVGGIVNRLPNPETRAFKKGEEKGYFDLHGSTIVLLFEKGRIRLNDDIASATSGGAEARVRYGQWIGLKTE